MTVTILKLQFSLLYGGTRLTLCINMIGERQYIAHVALVVI